MGRGEKTIEKLIQMVRDGDDPGERREAVIELGYKKSREGYEVLVEQLDDPAPSIRHAAVISLGRLGDVGAIEELVKPKIFKSPVTNIRWAAVSALGKLGDYRVIDHLIKAVDDHEWIVRNQAITEIKGKIQEIIEWGDIRCLRILLRLLSLDNSEIVELAIEGLCGLGIESIDMLIEALKNPSPLLRKNVAKTLGRMKAEKAVFALIELTEDPDWKVRSSAVEALGSIGNKRAVEPIVRCLSDNVERVQQQAMRSLLRFGKLSTEPLLNALLYEKDKFNLRAIILTLGELQDLKAVPSLINNLRSSYFVIRMAAVKALIKFGPQIKDSLIPNLSFNQSDIKQLLSDADNRDNPYFQIRAIKALGGLEDHRAVGLLKRLVEEGSPEVQDGAISSLIQIGCAAWGRCCTLMVLSQIGDESVIPYIIKSLKDDSDNVRLEAVRALARIGGSHAIKPLIETVRRDRDPYIRYEAIRLLRRIGVGYDEVLDLALSALYDDSRNVRSQAARLLGNFHNERSIRPLLKATADPHWSVRESAECSLLNFGQRAVPQLIRALNEKSWTTRFRAARLLGEIGDKRAIGPLELLLKKKGERNKVREVVRESLNRLYGSAAA